MDNLTHTLFAVTLARTPLGKAGRGTTAALVIASNAPDIDSLAGLRSGTAYLSWHRGPTHGPLGVVGVSLLTAAVVWWGRRRLDRERPISGDMNASFGMLLAVAAVGALLHIAMDFPTAYGIRLLSPFDWQWFTVDWMPIIDIYLLIALAAGLVFGRGSTASARRNAAIVLALMAANYGVRAAAHREALILAPRVFGPLLPQPCDAARARAPVVADWPRQPNLATTDVNGRRCLVEMAALPTFLSPFRWTLIAQMSNAYELHDVDVLDARLREAPPQGEALWRVTRRYPNQWAPPVQAAATTHVAKVFLAFSRYPAAGWVVDRGGITTVRWRDMRFITGPTPNPAPGGNALFTATVRLAPDGRVIDEHLGP